MAATAKLPNTWRTDGLRIGELSRWLFHNVKGDTALALYSKADAYGRAETRWFVVRYVDQSDKFERDIMTDAVREREWWKREIELLSCGRTPDEAVWYLRGRRATSLGKPIRDAHGEWVGVELPDGTRVENLAFVGASA